MAKKGSRLCKGTDLKVGDNTLGFGIVVQVTPGRHKLGARYQDVLFHNGNTHRCWEGFRYHVECEIIPTLENSTPRELSELS